MRKALLLLFMVSAGLAAALRPPGVVMCGPPAAPSSGSGGASWGTITGLISSQSDLNTALNGKQSSLGNVSGIVKGNGAGGYSAATPGTDYQPANANTAVGPGSSTAGHVAIFSGTDGKTLADGGVATSGFLAASSTEVSTGTDNTKGITPLALAGSNYAPIAGTKGAVLNTLVNLDLSSPEWDYPVGASYRVAPKEILPFYTTDVASAFNLFFFDPLTSFDAYTQKMAGFVAPSGVTSVTLSIDAKVPSGTLTPTFRFVNFPNNSTVLATTTPTVTTTLTTYSSLTLSVTPGSLYGIALLPTGQLCAGNIKVTPSRASSGVFASDFIRIDARGNMLDSQDGPLQDNVVATQSMYGRLAIQTDATDIVVEFDPNIYGMIPSLAKIGVWVNGRAYQELTGTSSNLQQGAVTLPTGHKLVEILSGPQSSGSGYPPYGAYVRAVYVPKSSRTCIVATPQGPRRLLIYSDSIASGQAATAPTMHAWPLVVRAGFPGSVMLDAWGSRSLYQDYNASGALAALVARFTRANPTDIWITIGTNDYGLNLWNATNFGIQYAALLDAIHAVMPNVRIWCQTPISRQSEPANGLGSTLPEYRTQISTAVSTRTTYCTLVDGTAIITTSDLYADGIHPNSVGQIRYGRSVLTTLGFTQ